MNPTCKLPCYMNSSSTKMLQIPSKTKGSNSKTNANSDETAASSSKMPQIPPKCWFELKHAANTIEMAASSSKMLQRARNMNRTGNPNKKLKTEKKRGPFRTHMYFTCGNPPFLSTPLRCARCICHQKFTLN